MKPTLAIIGTGIAGLSAAYFLKDKYKITLIEKNSYLGGHTNTIQVSSKQGTVPVDTGFMVFNEVTYPLFTKFIKLLGVESYNTDMSFSVFDRERCFEYNGSSLDGLFSQRKNLFNIQYIKMLFEVQRFSKMANAIITQDEFKNLSMQDFVTQYKFSKYFYNDFLIPMSSAVWSTPHQTMLKFPIRTLVRFFVNHGFLGLNTQHQWKTITGGSESYKKKILDSLDVEKILNNGVESISLIKEHQFKLTLKSKSDMTFDNVIIATHGNEALEILDSPTSLQQKTLSKFHYQDNQAWVHTDDSFMPKIKKNWCAWNYIMQKDDTFTVYWMNRLQPQALRNERNIFININGTKNIDPNKVIKKITYTHPLFDLAAIEAQSYLPTLNNELPGLYFCGSYFRYGFHEDALMSSVELCKSLLSKDVL